MTGVTVLQYALLSVAGVAGGLIGSVAGLASLATYPALLAVGLLPVTANVTNTVALIFSSIGSIAGSRPELVGQGRRLLRLAPIALAGGVVGCVLLLTTPAGGFENAVPVLLALASLTILIPRRRVVPGLLVEPGPSRRVLLGQGVGLFLIAIYGGFFGAAAGVLMLALLLQTTRASLPRANAAKNVLVGTANSVAAVGFMFFGTVDWVAVVPLAVGALIGSRIGPVVVRRAPALALRVLIGVAGLALAITLGIRTWS